jgi:MinD-like ATPase involved in chromosome partitioning or flagellar assembly
MTAPGPRSSAVLVVGANGGSGASLIAGALALAWTRAGSATWLLELDLGRGDRGEAWDLVDGRTLDDLVGVAGEIEPAHLHHAAHDHGSGLRVLLASSSSGSADEWGPESVGRLISAARAAAGDGGRVIIDGGPGLARAAAAASAHAGAILIVSSPSVAASRRARRIVEELTTRGADGRCGIVVNAAPVDAEIGARALGRAVGSPVLAEIPWSRREGDRLAAGRWPAGRRLRLAAAIETLVGAIG